MSLENLMATSEEDLFKFEQKRVGLDTDNTLIFEEITRELEAHLARESDDANSTESVFDFLTSLADQVQEEFENYLTVTATRNVFLGRCQRYSLCFSTQKLTQPKKILKILKFP